MTTDPSLSQVQSVQYSPLTILDKVVRVLTLEERWACVRPSRIEELAKCASAGTAAGHSTLTSLFVHSNFSLLKNAILGWTSGRGSGSVRLGAGGLVSRVPNSSTPRSFASLRLPRETRDLTAVNDDA